LLDKILEGPSMVSAVARFFFEFTVTAARGTQV
jgi:hypothetical protein